MSAPKVPPGRNWVRLSNPVGKTVLTFPGYDPTAPPPPKATVLRRPGPVGRTVLTFGPQPELRLSLRAADDGPDAASLAVLLKAFCDALSDYEQALGGVGMPLTDVITEKGRLHLTLSPIKPDGAEDRLRAIRELLVGVAAEPKPTPARPVGEALLAAGDPARWVRLALAALPAVEFPPPRNETVIQF